MPNFIPGLELSRLFFEEAVRPLPDSRFPSLRYSAALSARGWREREEHLAARVEDPRVRRLAGRRLLGSLDQFSDSTDLVSDASWRAARRRLYD